MTTLSRVQLGGAWFVISGVLEPTARVVVMVHGTVWQEKQDTLCPFKAEGMVAWRSLGVLSLHPSCRN